MGKYVGFIKENILIYLILWIVLGSPHLGFAQFDGKEDKESFSQKVTSDDEKALAKGFAEGKEALHKAAEQILAKDKNHLKALNALGIFYFKSKQIGLAKILFNRALQSHPESSALHNNIGLIWLAEDDERRALASFEKALVYESKDQMASANASSIYLKYSDFERAVGPLESAYKEVKSDLRRGNQEAIGVSNNYAVALISSGKADKGKDIIEKILEVRPRELSVLANYAILKVRVLNDFKDIHKLLGRLKFISDNAEIAKLVQELDREVEQKQGG